MASVAPARHVQMHLRNQATKIDGVMKVQKMGITKTVRKCHNFKSGGWLGFEPGSPAFMASALTSKLPSKLVNMSACLLNDGSRSFYQGLHCMCR